MGASEGERREAVLASMHAEATDVSQHEVRRFLGHTDQVNDARVSPDGKHVVSAHSTARFASGTQSAAGSSCSWEGIGAVSRHLRSPLTVAAPSGGEDRVVRLWDLGSGADPHVRRACRLGPGPGLHARRPPRPLGRWRLGGWRPP